jgi:ABC-type spermidine/putrescine transport system permease subunit I
MPGHRLANKQDRSAEWWLTLPSFGWLVIFFVIPSLIILVISFRSPDVTGGVGETWTLANWSAWLHPDVRVLSLRTLWISAVTTCICLALAIPMAWFMARCSAAWRNFFLLLVVIPFWTNFLIRIFAWKVLLNHDGLVTRIAKAIGLAGEGDTLLYNPGAVLLVLVYTHLPFAILPLYAAAEKFDFSLLDAARDLGATASRAFFTVFIPGIGAGISAAALLVFVPALGGYLIPDIVGGHESDMLGNRIAQRAFSDRNLPEASALASGLALAVIVIAAVLWRRQKPVQSSK